MLIENEETTIDETTTDATVEGVLDETTTTDDGAVETETETETVEETPEQKVEREKKERAGKRIVEAEAAEKRAEESRAKRQRERDEQERIERIAAKERQAAEMVARAQATLDELEERKKRIAAGGIEGLKALGYDYGKLTQEVLTANTPEAIAQQALARAERLEKQIEEERRQLKAQAEKQQIEETRQRFEAFVDGAADDFPHAAQLSPRMLRTLAEEEARDYVREVGQPPSFGALLKRVDEAARKEQEEVRNRSAKRARPATTTPSDGTTPPRDSTPNGPPASKPENRTLNGAAAGTKAIAKRPMTDEEIDEWALAELRQSLAADSKASSAE